MADVSISYKNAEIATMNATGVKTLLTGDCFCEDDIVISYTKPAAPTPTLQSKTVSPTTSQQTVSPDSGYDGLSSVTVNAMPSGSATTPATTITANPTISVSSGGLITASVSGSKSVTPTVSSGYVSSGTAGTVTVNGSNTQQLTTQAAQTITPTTTNQTIASGKYLTGTQTILGSENLLPENIKKDVVIFGITGTLESGGTYSRYGTIATGKKATTDKSITFTKYKLQAEPSSFTIVYNGLDSKSWSSLPTNMLISATFYKTSSGYGCTMVFKSSSSYLGQRSLPAGGYGVDQYFTITYDSVNSTLSVDIKSTAPVAYVYDTSYVYNCYGLY